VVARLDRAIPVAAGLRIERGMGCAGWRSRCPAPAERHPAFRRRSDGAAENDAHLFDYRIPVADRPGF
jgi:hypothetical protein